MKKPNLLSMSHNALTAYAELCRPVCKELEIPQTAFDILMFLADHPSLVTAKEITSHSGIKKNLVSMHVDRLVNHGYLKRESIPEDRRQVKLILTEKARPVIEKGHRAQKYYYDFLTKNLSEEELDVYKRCTETMAENIEELLLLLKEEGEIL